MKSLSSSHCKCDFLRRLMQHAVRAWSSTLIPPIIQRRLVGCAIWLGIEVMWICNAKRTPCEDYVHRIGRTGRAGAHWAQACDSINDPCRTNVSCSGAFLQVSLRKGYAITFMTGRVTTLSELSKEPTPDRSGCSQSKRDYWGDGAHQTGVRILVMFIVGSWRLTCNVQSASWFQGDQSRTDATGRPEQNGRNPKIGRLFKHVCLMNSCPLAFALFRLFLLPGQINSMYVSLGAAPAGGKASQNIVELARMWHLTWHFRTLCLQMLPDPSFLYPKILKAGNWDTEAKEERRGEWERFRH